MDSVDNTGRRCQEKSENPVASASYLSQIFFGWTLPIFIKGFTTDLNEDDLTEPLETHESSRLGNRLEKVWLVESAKNNPSLMNAVRRVFGLPCCLLGLNFLVIELILRIMEPLLLHQLLHYFASFSRLSLYEAKLYAWVLMGAMALSAIITQPMSLGMRHLGLKLRVALCSLVYRKVLRLNRTALEHTSVTQIVNFMTKDVARLDDLFTSIHMIWVGPIQAIILTVIIWEYIGTACVFGTVIILLMILLQGYLGKIITKMDKKTCIKTDERLRQMSDIINGIHAIKMHAWEKAFEKNVATARKKEIKQVSKSLLVYALSFSFVVFHARTSLFVSVLAYVILGNQVTAENVFVLTSIYNILRSTVSLQVPEAITRLTEGRETLSRIQAFLLSEESDNSDSESISKPVLILRRVSAKWLPDSTENILSGIDLEIKPGKLTAVVGTAGCGKSALVQALLKEMTLVEGSITIQGRLSYSSQKPWLFHSTLRQNVLFGDEYDAQRYGQVMRACCLLSDLKTLPRGDGTVVGEGTGGVLSDSLSARVNLARSIYKEADIYLLDDPMSLIEPHLRKKIFKECVQKFLANKTVLIVTDQQDLFKSADQIVLMDQGQIRASGTYRHLISDEEHRELIFTLCQGSERLEREVSFEEPVATTVLSRLNQQNLRDEPTKTAGSTSFNKNAINEETSFTKSESGISWSAFRGYFLASYKGLFFVLVICLFLSAQGLANASDYWLARWINLEEHESQTGNVAEASSITEECIDVFIWLTVATIVVTIARSAFYFLLCVESSRRLHDSMYDSISRAAMWFFNDNDSGLILSRFSKDMGSIDQVLPSTSIEVFQMVLTIAGVFVICCWINPWMLIPTVASLFVFYYLRRVFKLTSLSLKRLNASTRNPILNQLTDTIKGLETIRALKAQTALSHEFDRRQNLNTSASYLSLACGRCYALWLDATCFIYIVVATMGILYYPRDYTAGDVGLSVTQAIGLVATLQWAVDQTTELEEQMTSVERVLEYTGLDSEPSVESNDKTVPKSWPEQGKIIFQNVTMRRNHGGPLVLKDVNLTIHPKEKIGIIGASGSGKSSLAQALFRLTPFDGEIIIDGIDSLSIDLKYWRSKISVIPQNPVLFTGTIRKNLDPFETYSDDELWQALEEVELKPFILEMKHGLQSEISQGGRNLSVGQRRRVYLARAIIKKNNILVVDDAVTDLNTEAIIYTTIRRLFQEFTVLTVSHRLDAIMDSDKILVMDSGAVAEFDHPDKLLMKNEEIFRGLMENRGNSNTK